MMLRKLFRTLLLTLICAMALSIFLVLIMRWVNVPYSALMLERQLELISQERITVLNASGNPGTSYPTI